MKFSNRLNFMLAALLLTGFALACKFGDETEKANELVAQANTSIVKANEALQKGVPRIAEMEEMAGKASNQSDLDAAREVARECKETFSTGRDAYKEASSKFTEASKLKIHEKFKEYAETKAAELTKRSEMMTTGIDEGQALLDSENRNDFQAKAKAAGERFTKLKDEANELGKKADKIQTDNKDVFKAL